MEATSYFKKRRKYNERLTIVKTILQNHYQNPGDSILRYGCNMATFYYKNLNEIYIKNENLYNDHICTNHRHLERKSAIAVVNYLENKVRLYKSKIKEIDKLIGQKSDKLHTIYFK